jgi:hypothetical protein
VPIEARGEGEAEGRQQTSSDILPDGYYFVRYEDDNSEGENLHTSMIEPFYSSAADRAELLARAKALVQQGADVRVCDDDSTTTTRKNTALHFAARGGHSAVAELLLSRGTESTADMDWSKCETAAAAGAAEAAGAGAAWPLVTKARQQLERGQELLRLWNLEVKVKDRGPGLSYYLRAAVIDTVCTDGNCVVRYHEGDTLSTPLSPAMLGSRVRCAAGRNQDSVGAGRRRAYV